jgi:ABC-type dipeptide/oligopeptide/nickel transport system permease component
MAVTAPITAVEEQSSAASAAAFDAEALLARRRHWWTHPVLLYSLRRIGLYLITLWGSITAAFFFFHLIPGNPIDALILSLQQQGRYTSQGNSDLLVSYYKEVFGLNGTLWDQYTHCLRQLLVAHQFGPSLLNFPTDASVIILRALPWTLGLLGLSTLVGFVAGYKGGVIDGTLRTVTDMFLVIPTLPLLITLSAYVRSVSFPVLALLLAGFSWPFAARAIRTQVLSLRTRPYVELARMSVMGDGEIIFKELLPNLVGYIALGFAGAALGAIAALVGLEVIGLGPANTMDLGLLINLAQSWGVLSLGKWAVFTAPVMALVLLFVAMVLMNIGMEETFNPRLRRVTGR